MQMKELIATNMQLFDASIEQAVLFLGFGPKRNAKWLFAAVNGIESNS